MATNLDLDDRLIEEAVRIGNHTTKLDTVNAALNEYVQRRKQIKIKSLFGTEGYDYKKMRSR